MNLSRRFLRTAALGAVLALGLAGTALAEDRTWTGGASGTWSDAYNWSDSTAPGADEAAIFNKDVVIDGIGNADTTVGELKFTENATLTLNKDTDNKSLTVKKITVEAGKKAVVSSEGDDDKFVVADTNSNSIFNVGDDAVLTLTGKKIKGADELQLLGKGTLVLKAPVTTVTDLKITDGGTLVVEADGDLPALTGTPAITDGSIVINKENFGNVAAGLTLTKGNLTLNKSMKPNLKKVVITSGDLVVAQGVKIGKDTPLDGEVDLKNKGHLVLSGDLTLKDLKTADGSRITANGNVLTVINPTSPFVLDAEIDKGTLSLDVAAGQMATLSKDVASVVFNGKNGAAGAPTLKFEERVFVNHLDIRGSTTEPASLDFVGENTIGTLEFVRTTPLVVSYRDLFVKVEKLILAGGAALDLELRGGTALTIKDGTPGKNWNVTMGNKDTDFRVGNAGLLSGNVEVTLGGGTLYLPHGAYPNLILKAVSPPVWPTIQADVFEGDPVLTVGKVEISGSDMRVKADETAWRHGLEAGKTLTLLEVNETALSDDKVIKGDPERNNDYWESKWERLEGNKKTKLVLTASKDLTVPDLVAEASYSGNKCTVNVKVSGDVKVNESNWNAEMILGDRPENDPAYKPGTNTERGAVFEVMLPSGFTSGTLRVKATNKEGGNFQGFVDVPLERTTPGGGGGGGGGGGDTPGTPGTPAAPSIDPSGWETTTIGAPDAQGNVTVRLTATLSLEGTPKSLEVVASGMKEKPKAELLDAGGNVVVSSMPSVVGAGAKSYRLRLTCRTTKADIDAGRAAIEKVLVTTDDGKVHTINVNKKLKDIAKPGGNPEQPNPGNPGQPDNPGDSKSGSGGGCDAGFGGLALVFTAAFLLRRKA